MILYTYNDTPAMSNVNSSHNLWTEKHGSILLLLNVTHSTPTAIAHISSPLASFPEFHAPSLHLSQLEKCFFLLFHTTCTKIKATGEPRLTLHPFHFEIGLFNFKRFRLLKNFYC